MRNTKAGRNGTRIVAVIEATADGVPSAIAPAAGSAISARRDLLGRSEEAQANHSATFLLAANDGRNVLRRNRCPMLMFNFARTSTVSIRWRGRSK